MGSGGLVVIDEGECAVEIARYFLSFTQRESCGKCTFCRVGTKRMLEILERISSGNGRLADRIVVSHQPHVPDAGSVHDQQGQGGYAD